MSLIGTARPQIRVLGEHGADPNLRNDEDRTPLLLIEYVRVIRWLA